MIHAFWTTYATVLAAEVLGDKFLYTTGFLATRYRTTPMMIGIAVAFMAKMGVAVAVGDAIAVLPRLLIAVVTVAGVVGIGRKMWNEPDTGTGPDYRREHSNAEAAMVSCGSVLFSEWADLGQVAAATMAVQFRAPLLVWMGAVAAMMTKAILAAAVGAKVRVWLREHVPEPIVRYGALSVLVLLGALSVAETLLAQR